MTMRRDAAENHAKILATATTLFAQFGVANVGMKQLAAAANIGIGTLYRNYPNKGALCLALSYDSIQRFVDHQNAYLDATTEPPRRQLTRVLRGYLDVRQENEDLLVSIETESSPAQLTQILQSPIYTERVALLLRVLARVQPDCDPEYRQFEADMLVAMLKSRVYTFERHQRQPSTDQLLTYLLQLLGIPED